MTLLHKVNYPDTCLGLQLMPRFPQMTEIPQITEIAKQLFQLQPLKGTSLWVSLTLYNIDVVQITKIYW